MKLQSYSLYGLAVLSGLVFGSLAVSAEISPPEQESTVIIVDKKTNKLHLARNKGGHYSIFKTYHATLGKALGDKMIEGDLRTPEGIYQFEFRSLPSTGLKPKFGSMAVYVNYPNPLDRLARKTGYDILIHGTDQPERLKLDRDSEGCIVVANEQLEEIWPYIKLKDTKLIVTRDAKRVLNNARKEKLRAFFQRWLEAWERKDLDAYIDSYGHEFTYDKMSLVQYRDYKERLNKVYDKIKLAAKNVEFFFHEKYDVVTFEQNYQSFLPGNKPAFATSGRKALFVQLRNDEYKIVIEDLQK